MEIAYRGLSSIVREVAVGDGVLHGVVVQLHQQHPVALERDAALVEGHVATAAHSDDVQVDAAEGADLRS